MATFGEITKVLLFEKENYGSIYQCVHALHDFYASVTGISADQTNDNNIHLPVGKAISPGQAANCLLDLRRTAVFLRGIYKSILQLQKDFPDQPIHILYAGCGPYASLLTPITAMFGPEQVRYHLMDVQQPSLEAAKKLYEYLQATNYVEEFIHADASTYRIDKPMHLVIVEAMQAALIKEPQVAITQNLIPQMMDGAIFLPQEISITAQLLDLEQENNSYWVGGPEPTRINLGEIYRIGQDDCCDQKPVTIQIPTSVGTHVELHLLTEVRVYEDEKLVINNCGITVPLYVANVSPYLGKQARFEYEITEKPGFKSELLHNATEAISAG
jgi:hypothetical protein